MVENPATSSPGLAFLLATIARFGADGWRDYWAKLRANDVKVVDGWEQAYDGDFTAGREPRRPTRSSSRTRRARRPPCTTRSRSPRRRRSAPCSTRASGRSSSPGCSKGTDARGRGAQARRLHALGDVPGRHPAADVRVPGARRHAAPRGVREVRRGRAASPLHAARRPRSARTATRGSSSGPTPSCGDAVARGADLARARAARVPRRLLRLPGGRDRRARPRARRPRRPRSARRGRHRRLAAPRRVVHACGRPPLSTVLTAAGRAAGRVRPRPLRVPGAPRRARAGDRPVRAPDRGRGLGVRGPARPRRPARRARLDQTVWAILLAHVFFNYAVVVRTVGGLWAHLDPHAEEAARMLGAEPRGARSGQVTLPALRPAIVAAATIVFLFTFTSFGVILLLGGPRFVDARDRDLPPDRAAARPAARRRAHPRAARRRRGAAPGDRAARGPPQRRAAAALGARDRPPPAHRRRRVPSSAANLALMAAAARRAAARARRAVAAPARRLRPRLLPRPGRRARGQHAVRAAGRRDRQLAAVRGDRHRARGGRRRVRGVRAGGVATARPRHAPVAAARRLGGDRRLRLPHRARRATARPPRLVVAGPDRAGARGDAVRGAHRDPGAARHRPAPAGSRGDAGRVPGARVARGRPADRRARAARGGRLRVRDLARRVRRHRLHRAARHADAARRHLPAARPTRSAELRRRDGRQRDPHGADRRRHRSASSASASARWATF